MKKYSFSSCILISLLIAFLWGIVPISYSDDFDIYIQWLSSPDRYHREYAAFMLGQAKDPRAVVPLIAALKDEDKNVREDAAISLGKIGDKSAVQPLIGVLNDLSIMVKIAAVRALGQLKDISAVAPITGLLQDRDPRVRGWSARILGELKDTRALEPLLNASLNDQEMDVRLVAASAMCFMQDTRGIKPLLSAVKTMKSLEELGSWVVQSFLTMESSAIEPMKDAIKDKDSDVRLAILDIIELMKDPRAIDILIEATKDLDEDVRLRAVQILEKKNDPRTIEPVIRLLKDTEEDVRAAAVRFLGKSENPIVIDPLTTALGDPEWKVQEAAAAALIPFKDQRATRPLIAAMKDDDVMVPAHKALAEIGTSTVEFLLPALKSIHEYIRIGAANALGLIKDERAIQPLIAALGDPKGDVREAAAKAIANFGTMTMEPLIPALKAENEDIRSGAAIALGEIKDSRALEPLLASLKDEESDVRESAARALGNIADQRAVDALIEALKDRDSDVREAAAYALGKINDPKAVRPLLAAVFDRDDDVQLASAESLSVFKETKAIKPMLKLTVSSPLFPNVSKKAREVIIKFGDAAVETLISALNDNDDKIIFSAVSILGDLNDTRAVEPLSALLTKEGFIDDFERRRKTDLNKGKMPIRSRLYHYLNIYKELKKRTTSEGLFLDPITIETFDVLQKINIDQDKAVSTLNRYTSAGRPTYPALLFGALSGVLDKGGPNVNDVLIKAIVHEDPEVRMEAGRVISKIGDKQMLEKLADLLRDNNVEVRIYTAYYLLKNGDDRGLEVFSKCLQKLDTNTLAALDKKEINERQIAADLLFDIGDLHAADLLLNLLTMRDIAGIAGAYRFYLKYQIDSAENLLIATLKDYGTVPMVEAYLNYGSILLTREAEKWVRNHGYIIVKKKLVKMETTP